jgi:hypothetical protein
VKSRSKLPSQAAPLGAKQFQTLLEFSKFLIALQLQWTSGSE